MFLLFISSHHIFYYRTESENEKAVSTAPKIAKGKCSEQKLVQAVSSSKNQISDMLGPRLDTANCVDTAFQRLMKCRICFLSPPGHYTGHYFLFFFFRTKNSQTQQGGLPRDRPFCVLALCSNINVSALIRLQHIGQHVCRLHIGLG